MALPWGVKEDVAPQAAQALKDYLSQLLNQNLNVSEDFTVDILKADVKERKGKYMMILRYQIISPEAMA